MHADCVKCVPEGFRSIGGNSNTSIQGMLSRDKNVLTFQSHPEFDRNVVRQCTMSIVKKFGPIKSLTKGVTKSMEEFSLKLSHHADDSFVRAAILGHLMRGV